MREVKRIILHCSASDIPMQDAAMIDRWHKARGFNKIGYHYFIRHDGAVEKGRGLEEVGAHAEGYNKDSIGICLAGLTIFTPLQMQALAKLLDELKPLYPKATVHGHREFNQNKTCPVFDYSEFKRNYEWTGTSLLPKIFRLLSKVFLRLSER